LARKLNVLSRSFPTRIKEVVGSGNKKKTFLFFIRKHTFESNKTLWYLFFISKESDVIIGRHFEHALFHDHFYDKMEGVDYIFILQKPINLIGHLDNILEIQNAEGADVLISNLRTKADFHKKVCEAVQRRVAKIYGTSTSDNVRIFIIY
jgi:hypothetical protein